MDLGYIGFDKDYEVENLHIPNKKPPRSKNNPNPSLTTEQRLENKTGYVFGLKIRFPRTF